VASAFAVICFASAVGPVRAEAPSPTVEQLLGMRMLRSPSGRFAAYGTNTLQVLDVARWADSIAGRIDRTLGASPPNGWQPARLVLRDDPASTSGWVRVAVPSPALQIVVANYATVDVMAVGRAIVGGLLSDFYVWGASQTVEAAQAPDWLVTGMMSAIDSEVREDDYGTVFRLWRDGSLPPLAECLGRLPSAALPDAISGVIVQWVLSLKGRGACIRDIMRRSAGGVVPRPDWFYQASGCSSPAELESAWEKWLVGRQWVIGAAGRRAHWIAERIREERLIYPGDSGIPSRKPGEPPLTPEELIGEAKSQWARDAAGARAVRLRVLSAGRGSEVGGVLEAYIRFFDAVRDGKKSAELKVLLEQADRLLGELESSRSGRATGTNSGAKATGIRDRGTER
jgi:hypothetical protein